MSATRNERMHDQARMKPELAARCCGVRVLVDEMHGLAAGTMPAATAHRRRSLCHLRQIAMYVCHVVLQLSLTEIGLAYGRDRTTVGYACQVIEDRRDDRAYDEFVSAVERVAAVLFVGAGAMQDGE